MMTRRRWLQAACASLALPAHATLRAAPAHGADLKLGVQLWTLKDELERDYLGTLRQLARIGLHRVELFELGGRSARQVRSDLRAAELECVSAHIRLWELEADLDGYSERAHQIGIKTLVVALPWIPPESMKRALGGEMQKVLVEEMTLDAWKRTAELLNSYGAKLKKAGLALAYHNHNIDFKRFGDHIAYDLLVASTEAGLVGLELDCGWVESAGLDPTSYLRRWPHRYMALHVKDVKAGFEPNFALATLPTEVGSGVMDWPAILQAAYTAGVRQYYIEQEAPFVLPPIESVKISFDYVTKVARRIRTLS
jgi:sugar phosphate isomerase/epimerase